MKRMEILRVGKYLLEAGINTCWHGEGRVSGDNARKLLATEKPSVARDIALAWFGDRIDHIDNVVDMVDEKVGLSDRLRLDYVCLDGVGLTPKVFNAVATCHLRGITPFWSGEDVIVINASYDVCALYACAHDAE